MAKRRRTKRAVRVFPKSYSADIMKGAAGPDRRFPKGLKGPGGRWIVYPYTISSRRISEHSAITAVPETQTHGKRGRVMARAHTPYVEDTDGNVVSDNVPLIYKEWASAFASGITRYNAINLKKSRLVRATLFFAGQEHFIIEEDFVRNTQSISRTFTDSSQIKLFYERGWIRWVKTLPLKKVPPS